MRKGCYNMKGKFITGVVTGAVIGATTSMLMMPQMDGRTRRRINKMSRRMSNRAGEFMDDLKGSMM